MLWRFRANTPQKHVERRAARIAGVLLFVLAAYVFAAAASLAAVDDKDLFLTRVPAANCSFGRLPAAMWRENSGGNMTVQRISAITLRVSDMARAVEFYRGVLGLGVLYGGPATSFSSLRTA